MPFQIGIRIRSEVVILDCVGRLILSDGSKTFEGIVNRLIDQEYLNLVINMDRLTEVDASGTGYLVSSYARVAFYGGTLKLLAPREQFQAVLKYTNLAVVLEVFHDEETAVRSFFKRFRALEPCAA